MPPRAPYRIVVGVSNDLAGDVAVAEALRLAREHPNDELHPVHVIELMGDHHDADEIASLEGEMSAAEEWLRGRVQVICERGFPGERWEQPTRFHVRLGAPAEALHQVAVDYEADLIVVGTHERTGFDKLVLGSVAAELVHTARCPVLVARERHFEGLTHTDRVDAARPGESLERTRYHHSEIVRFGRGTHIAYLL